MALVVLSLMILVCEIYAEYCGNGLTCDYPYRCCEPQKYCCYDSRYFSRDSTYHRTDNTYSRIGNTYSKIDNTYGKTHTTYNGSDRTDALSSMQDKWIWLTIVALVVLGIAYCGFYLCRRLAKLNRVSGPSARRSTRSNEQGHDRGERNEGIVDPFCYVACDEPFLNHLEQDSNLPPAYAEVVSHPNLYPVNKTESQPGINQQGDHIVHSGPGLTALAQSEPCLPPPYSQLLFSDPLLQPAQFTVFPQCVPSSGNVEQLPTVPASRSSNTGRLRNSCDNTEPDELTYFL